MPNYQSVEPKNDADIKYGYADLPRLMSLQTGDEKHSSSATSTLDVLWVLYDQVLRFDSTNPTAQQRDRFILSKGHGPMAYYAILTAKGFIDESDLAGFARFESPLGQHPDRNLISGVEAASGSLGHGLPIAVGVALGLAAKGNTESHVYCLVGDGEMDEGSNHEAIAFAGRVGLDRLTALVIDNGSASHGWPGGLASRFELEGWSAATIGGRDHDAIKAALTEPHAGRPRVVVFTVEGS